MPHTSSHKGNEQARIIPSVFLGFSKKQTAEIEVIFEEFEQQAPAERIADHLRYFIASQQKVIEGSDPLSNAAAGSKIQQKACAQKIQKLAEDLQKLMRQAGEPKFAILDPDDLRSNIIGSLALTGWARREQDICKQSDAEWLSYIETGTNAFNDIDHGLEHLAWAASKWLSYFDMERGRPPSLLHELICQVALACESLLPLSETGRLPRSYKPAAPNSVVCRTLAIALEALEWEAPANLPQAVRRALELQDKFWAKSEAHANAAQGFSDHK